MVLTLGATKTVERDEALASVIVPFNREAEDYGELFSQALSTLWRMAPRVEGAADLLDELTPVPGDQLRFEKNVATVNGAVPWLLGQELVESARASLVAGAKARLSKRAYYGNANGRFAKRFIESVLMGQTEIGSYVVTAFSPPDQAFPEKETLPGELSLPSVAIYTGRQIVQSLVDALSATLEAVRTLRAPQLVCWLRGGGPAGCFAGAHRCVARDGPFSRGGRSDRRLVVRVGRAANSPRRGPLRVQWGARRGSAPGERADSPQSSQPSMSASLDGCASRHVQSEGRTGL